MKSQLVLFNSYKKDFDINYPNSGLESLMLFESLKI